jgi:adenylate cyclase class 2
MQSAEIELKFPIDDPGEFESRLPGMGFHLETRRTFEQNTLYDTPGRTLRESKQILRLRQYGPVWTVTHKRQAAPSNDGVRPRYKLRIETETHVDDGPAMGTIFEQMGFGPVFRYEKYRTEWSQGVREGVVAHLVIDDTAIGNFVELEGPPEWIDETLARLAVDPATCLTDSYGKMFLDWKARTGSAAENLTFEEIGAVLQGQV